MVHLRSVCFIVCKDKLKIPKVIINNIEFYFLMCLMKCLGVSVLVSEIYFKMHLGLWQYHPE